MSKDIEDLAEALEGQKYAVVGEIHRDPYVGEDVVEPLLESGNFDNLYMEAVLQGNYSEQGEEILPEEDEEKVYNYDMDKYDSIIETAEREDVEVHGVDNPGDSRPTIEMENSKTKDWNKEVGRWADYILDTADENNLVLVGDGHAHYWPYLEKDRNLPYHLVKNGAEEEEITTITCPENYHNEIEGVYSSEELEEDTGDFIYLNPSSNTDDQEELKARKAMRLFG